MSIARVSGLTKKFGATRALDCVDFDVRAGEIHALVGENGAGKSTLVRILGGVHRPDSGTLEVEGRPARFASPREAIAAGIVTIPQELRLVPALSVAENLTLGSAPHRRILGLAAVDRTAMREEARRQLEALDFAPDPDARVDTLSFAERQMVAIGKALRQSCRLLILDEPTAALEAREVQRLFAVLARMKQESRAIVYISHRLDEVVQIADRCTVLRDGGVTAAVARGAFGVSDLVQAMTGRAGADVAIEPRMPGPMRLEETQARTDSIAVPANQVVGLAGLLGSGTSAMLRRLFGATDRPAEVNVDGHAQRITSPRAAIDAGIGMVPGERRLGLIMGLSIADNILLASLGRLTTVGQIDRARGAKIVAELMEALDIRPRQPDLAVSALSGGNQQKVILAKWLARDVGVLLLDEPTQGVDVAAKAQIHALLRDFAAKGGAVLMSSSDTAEIERVCDAVLAVREGRVVERLERAEGFDEQRLHAAIGG